MASYELQPVRVRTGTEDRDGRLILLEGELTAVVVLLADKVHGDQRGLWSLEADFRTYLARAPLFRSPHDAVIWLQATHKPPEETTLESDLRR